MNQFRLLRADEIDCRINTITEKGLSLLLYKDARCDMNILDETVGPMNWTRSHLRENANCVVSIWDEKKGQWVSKEDTGTESNTEAAKGLASDSFKRACFCWGIGRELYTAPFIWISADKCNIRENGTDRNGKKRFACYDRFEVEKIAYSETSSEISGIAIRNAETGKRVFSWASGPKKVTTPQEEQKADTSDSKRSEDYSYVGLACCECGSTITEAERNYSMTKWRKPLCRACQKKQ